MRISRSGRFVSVCVVVVCLFVAGCRGNAIEGTYHGNGMVLDFKGDKVTVTVMGESKTFDYKVEEDKITIFNAEAGDLVLTRNSDGSLNSPMMGTFTKKTE
jgi:hypothetical protein